MGSKRIVLEGLKILYGLFVGGIVFLFFCLLLDVFALTVAGGWNPLLGSWPIFSGTVASVIYGEWGVVLCLLIGVGTIARIILWDRTPFLLAFVVQQEG
jgi:hypothetical protein